MTTINVDDIIGANTKEGHLCADHMPDPSELTLDELITSQDVEGKETLYYCDECGALIT